MSKGKTTRRIERSIFTLLVDDKKKLYIPEIKAELVEKRVPLPVNLDDMVKSVAPEGYKWADGWSK